MKNVTGFALTPALANDLFAIILLHVLSCVITTSTYYSESLAIAQ
jgi:hypothetical protein